MPALKSLQRGDPVECQVRYGEETVTLHVDRARVTPNWMKRLGRAIENDDPTAASQGLVEVLISWDIVDEDNQPVPMSVEVISDLPSMLIGRMYREMRNAVVPSRAEGEASSRPLEMPPSVSTVPLSQNGPAVSTSPVSSASPSPT